VQARLWKDEGRRPKLRQLLFRFPLRFVQGYVLRLGFLDGLAGLQVCAMVAYASWLKQACLWQLQSSCETLPALLTAPGSVGGFGLRGGSETGSTTGGAGGCRIESSGSDITQEQLSTGGATRTQIGVQAAPRRSFREWRHQITPRWLRTDARRRRRNMLFRRLGYQRCFTPPILIRDKSLYVRSSLRYVVANELLTNPRMTFLQIGAFDGVGEDDLRELIHTHKLRGVLVEPQPAAFARLQQTYRNQHQVTLLQAAIAESEDTRDLYCHRGHASMSASFDRKHLRKHGILDQDIVVQPVPCHTVESALRSAGLANVDLIQIDAEGYDWPIIRSMDFILIKPRMLRFEYRHMPDADADACLAHLASHGYRFILESHDIIAVHVPSVGNVLAPPKRRSA
jgi:FkbM family methyltransferase